MKKIDRVAILEGLKELLRTATIAVIPLVISGLQEGKVEWRAIGISAVIVMLSGIDKWLHKKEIETPLDFKFIK